MPSNPLTLWMTEVIQASGKFLRSPTLRPFTSLKLWRTLNSFSSCSWTLFKRSRTPRPPSKYLSKNDDVVYLFFFLDWETHPGICLRMNSAAVFWGLQEEAELCLLLELLKLLLMVRLLVVMAWWKKAQRKWSGDRLFFVVLIQSIMMMMMMETWNWEVVW